MFRHRLLTVSIIILIIIVIGLAGTGIGWMETTTALEAYNQNNLIRLHVIANSNSVADQVVKIKVRDQIIKITEPLLIKVQDPQDAVTIIKQNIGRIREAANEELRRNGMKMTAQVILKEEYFPERVYSFGVLPAGQYRGLAVKLGDGIGQNWWCVLYPPLCFIDEDASVFKNEMNGPVKVEYRLMALEKLIKEKGLTMDSFWTGWAKYFGIL